MKLWLSIFPDLHFTSARDIFEQKLQNGISEKEAKLQDYRGTKSQERSYNRLLFEKDRIKNIFNSYKLSINLI